MGSRAPALLVQRDPADVSNRSLSNYYTIVEDNKKKVTDADPDGNTGKPKRRWKYVGQAFQTGICLPDLTTIVNPTTISDDDIDAYVKRWTKLRGKVWKEV
ncbi:MAG: hypothetical protein JNM22_05660 [Saprospiraceae bacterium]|nr:hypothetical protein [Saprospiraceae bacterium]